MPSEDFNVCRGRRRGASAQCYTKVQDAKVHSQNKQHPIIITISEDINLYGGVQLTVLVCEEPTPSCTIY